VIPTISADGYVMLQVSQEINAATAEQQFNAPVISTRSVQTRLLVRDGQTIVLGGLIDRQREVTRSGVPFLSSIPVIGFLFGRVGRHRAETELFLFLTPRVLRGDDDVDAWTRDYREQSRKVKP
jgi:type II secretory pathway component GspD/PulD (secretin)